jgi:hypothetical protein
MKPFLFLSKQSSVQELSHRLEHIGLNVVDIQESSSAYVPAVVALECPWLEGKEIKIIWERQWWPDGHTQEDSAAILTVNRDEKCTIDISGMLRMKLESLLVDEIINRLVSCASEVTGKAAGV